MSKEESSTKNVSSVGKTAAEIKIGLLFDKAMLTRTCSNLVQIPIKEIYSICIKVSIHAEKLSSTSRGS